MKFVFLLFLMSITLFSAQLQWLNDYDEALKNAQKEHKLVYILVVSDTCKWCKKFENKTLQNKQIKERVNKEFVTVLLSRDTDVIPKGLKISPVPRHYFLDEKGKILYSSVGYRDTELFNSFMDNAQEHYEILKDNNNETSTDN
ncbi:MAG TPA: thioredoxin family protein [Sulfurimonas autotrophica]|nr:thioredoxin family protein [Sulfurimonas autotrophica]